MAVYGLQRMTSSQTAPRRLLAALADVLDATASYPDPPQLSGQEIAMILHGLQGMRSDSPEVRRFLESLAAGISRSTLPMSGLELSTALGGLQSMGLGLKLGAGESGAGAGAGAGSEHQRGQRRQRHTSPQAAAAGFTENEFILFNLPHSHIGEVGACWPAELSAGAGTGAGVDGNSGKSSTDDMTSGSSSGSGGSSSSSSGGRRANKWTEPPQLIALLRALAEKLQARSAPLSAPQCCSALLGLQYLSTEIGAQRKILECLAEDLELAAREGAAAGASASASASANTDAGAVAVAGVGAGAAPSQPTALDSRNIGNALYGLRNLRSSRRVVLRVLAALTDCIEASPAALTAQGVGNAFYGLQGMSSDKPEVRRVLSVLADKVDKMAGEGPTAPARAPAPAPAPVPTPTPTSASASASGNASVSLAPPDISRFLSGQNIGNALWGLRNMTDAHPEVRQALRSLSVQIRASPHEMNGQNIANALYSFNSMTSEHSEVRETLAALAHKLALSQGELSGLDIGMALYGLRNMDSDTPEVRVLLGLLILKIRQSRSQLQLRDLSRALVGLLKAQDWILDDFMSVLAEKTPGMTTVK